MKKPLALCLFLLVNSLLLTLSSADIISDAQEIFDSQRVNINLKNQESKTFMFRVKISGFSDFVIHTQSFHSTIHPQSKISMFSSLKPDGSPEVLSSCNTKIFEPCFFDLDPNSNQESSIYLLIECFENKGCAYEFLINHISEIHLEHNNPLTFTFFDDSEEFNFTVPGEKEFDRMLFSILHKNAHPIVNFYENRTTIMIEHNNINLNAHVRELPDRLFVTIPKEHKGMCFNCNLSAVVYSPIGSIMEVELFSYSQITKIKINKTYTDFVRNGLENIYEIDVDDPILMNEMDGHIHFSLSTLTGKSKNLFVNGDNKPQLLSQYTWSSSLVGDDYYEEEDIVINRQEIKNKKLSGKKFFVAVSSELRGAYQLKVNIRKERLVKIHLGVSETGTVMNEEVINYEMEIFDAGMNEDSYSAILGVERGNVNMFMRFCDGFNETCRLITAEHIKNNQNIDYSAQHEKNDRIKFGAQCPKGQQNCFVSIAVQGRSELHDSNRYSLLVKRDDLLLNLKENSEYVAYIESGEFQVYRLYVEDHNIDAGPSDIMKVKFSITADLIFEVSHNINCVIEKTKCSGKVLVGDVKTPVFFNTNNTEDRLSGEYFLYISGLKSTKFTILPIVTRNSQKSVPKIKLHEGVLHRGTLTQDEQSQYFSFKVDFKEHSDIEVSVMSARDDLMLYVVNDDQLPSKSHSFWSSTRGSLVISKDNNERYQNKEIYTMLMVPKSPIKSETEKDVAYTIFYATNKTVRTIENNHIYYDQLKGDSVKYAVFFVDKDEGIVKVTLDVISPKINADLVQIYIAQTPFNHSDNLLNSSVWHKTTYKHDTSTITIESDELMRICVKQDYHCPIYITIESKGDKNMIFAYSVRVLVEKYATELLDGKEQQFALSEMTHEWKMYFEPHNKSNSIDVFLYSYYGKFSLFVSLFNNVNKQFITNWKFPTSNLTSLFTFRENNKQSVSISPKKLEGCWPNCVVLMYAEFIDDNNDQEFIRHNKGEIPFDYYINDKLYVLVSSNIMELHDNSPVSFTCVPSSYKYFFYDLSQVYADDNLTIIISLTTYFGSSDLYARISNDTDSDRPNSRESNDFYANHGQLKINKQILKDAKSEVSFPGKFLLIGIETTSSEQSSQMSILVYPSKNPMISLIHGTPFDVQLAPKEIIFFEFYNYYFKEFTIRINREYGLGILKVSACPESRNLKDCLESPNYTSYITGQGSASLYMSKKYNFYCIYCSYIITLEGSNNFKGSINVYQEDEFVSLQSGKLVFDSQDVDKESLYSFSVDRKKSFDIKLNVFSGDPVLYFSVHYQKNRKNFDVNVTKNNQSFILLSVPSLESFTNDTYSFWDVTQTVYLLVWSGPSSPANYSISYLSGREASTLQSGIVDFGFLPPLQNKSFIYHYFDSQFKASVTIQKLSEFLPNLTVSFKFLKQDTPSDYSQRMKEISVDICTRTDNNLVYELPNLANGTWVIDILNMEKNQSFNFSISANARDVTFLQMSMPSLWNIEKDNWKFFEIYVPEKGTLALNLLQCTGSVEYFVVNEYSKLFDKDYEEFFKNPKGEDFFNLLKGKKGMVYVGVNGIQKSVFSFEYRLFDYFTDVPRYRLMIAGKPDISWSYSMETDSFTFSFAPVKCRDCSAKELDKSNVVYRLYSYSNEQDLNSYVKCKLQNLTNSEALEVHASELMTLRKSSELDTITFTRSSSKKWDPLYFAVVADVQEFDTKPVIFSYSNLELHSPKSFFKRHHTVFFFLATGTIIVTMLLCLLGCFYYYRRFKATEKKLKYEMQDVRNMAQITALSETPINNPDFGVEMGDRSIGGTGGYKGLSTQENV